MSELREECGVFGIYSPVSAPLANSVYYGLFALQHRGQESCGIVVNDHGVFSSYRNYGLVGDVFTPEVLSSFPEGNLTLGHVRYGTSNRGDRLNTQPILVDHIKGKMAIANNGALTNYHALREELELRGSMFHTTSDAELIAGLIVQERLTHDSVEEALESAMDKLEGAYSLVIMSASKLIAARDPRGFHPLCYGKREDGSYVVASESCALDVVGAAFEKDIEPGEIVVFDKNGPRSLRKHCGSKPHSMCVFEFVYFSRPDSVVDGSSVHMARKRAGMFLAQEHKVDADVVIGVPDSGIDAAIGYAEESGIPYGFGLLKNKYIGRTFIAPSQKVREDKVRIKLNPVPSTVKGKRVVLIDDSIVRGTTCAKLVKLLRDAGATEVHMRVSAPPFVNTCYYGTDIESQDVLIAYKHTQEEIKEMFGVDSLGFLSLEHVKQLAEHTDLGFCTACFDHNYPTEPPVAAPKCRYDSKITDCPEGGNQA